MASSHLAFLRARQDLVPGTVGSRLDSELLERWIFRLVAPIPDPRGEDRMDVSRQPVDASLLRSRRQGRPFRTSGNGLSRLHSWHPLSYGRVRLGTNPSRTIPSSAR